MSSETFDNDDSVNPDQSSPGWQPLLDRPGYEQWWDGASWRGRAHREPDPFSAFSTDFARSLRPGPNRAARFARWGIAAIILGFVLQTVIASEVIVVPGVEQIALIVASIALTAVLGIATAVTALLGLKAATHLGGRAISTLALGASIVLGMAPVLLLVAIGLAGGV